MSFTSDKCVNYYNGTLGDCYYNEGLLEESFSDTHPLLATVYYLMFVFSLYSNGLVIVIIYRFEKLTTVTNILLLNLVLSSLVFMSSMLFWGVYLHLSYWIFGRVMCKIVGSIYYLGFYSSVLFLALLTFDRHLAVVYSISASRMRSKGYAVVSCTVVWIISSLACINPMILHNSFHRSVDNKIFCQEYMAEYDAPLLRSLRFNIQFFLFFLFPLLVIVYCYVRITITVLSSQIVTKFKTVRLIFVIVLLFFTCWTPFNIAMLMYEKAQNPAERAHLRNVLMVTQTLAHIYFCISPLFYTFVGRKFQNYFRAIMVKHFPRLKKHISVSQLSRTNISARSTPNDL